MTNIFKITLLTLAVIVLLSSNIYADPEISILGKTVTLNDTENPDDYVFSIQLLVLLTILTLAPAILIMMTSFTRIIIVLSLIRNALATQQTPPNQVLIGLALFLTFFIMSPIASEINEDAIQPYLNEEINQREAIDKAIKPLREFMFKQTRKKDLALFMDISNTNLEDKDDLDGIPTRVLIPAFIISELKTAFQIGFILFIPFLVIDMVVASTLMSMGMMMLPPVMISLPFKILLFVMVDGWHLIVKALLLGFR
ncbi:flagellar type III secretion system pore protein FliP [Thermohalobacter berrensis]|uniref:Flagellar biosynthetic protein FliP n=1 Tax=Thermohalobacter berrensis TaxID=99594 RepID=A0A419TAF2_9FIRM|nr:flagellar type III secretion system pore protein FliP [Thermohalobacter berrensis]RKD34448.1 flagellar biosynthetic protein FliP [Thermohalobacter berrensis]